MTALYLFFMTSPSCAIQFSESVATVPLSGRDSQQSGQSLKLFMLRDLELLQLAEAFATGTFLKYAAPNAMQPSTYQNFSAAVSPMFFIMVPPCCDDSV